MSHVSAVLGSAHELGHVGAAGSASAFMAGATNIAIGSTPSSSVPPSKKRSCVICRRRKVRCDKLFPCTTCRRAKIDCVVPSTDRPPRWARRLERSNAAAESSSTHGNQPNVSQATDRLRNLESLVRELSGQLEQANAAAHSIGNIPGSFPHGHDIDHQIDSSSTANTTSLQKQFGRIVLQDASRTRYVSSGFWSRVHDEIKGLKMETGGLTSGESDTSENEDSPGKTPPSQEFERAPLERHGFLFGHNLGSSNPDIREFHPLPSQIPFLLNVYNENVNQMIQIVHIPTITKMIRNVRSNSLTPANEALMFAIYYAAVTSMEEDDIMRDFGCKKADLSLKYRLGLEHALAKADFLNVPDLVTVQAFAIFLFLVRRYESPTFVWMMTGLVIRIAQALGLHRDPSHFENLTPYEAEIRRRVWWALCALDVRASVDQGMDLTITGGSFDTELPLNINDADIRPQMKETPIKCESVTDMTFAFLSCEVCNIVRQLLAPAVGKGAKAPGDQDRLLNEIYENLNRPFLQHWSDDSENIVSWTAIIITRLVYAKMTLIIYLPVLFAAPSEHLSEDLRTRLLISAIEVAEYNHRLNAEKACRQWRWIYQTYTHWHAIVYLLLESARRSWSPIVERAWVALHSSWLIPVQSKSDKSQRIWVPLRKLMVKARKHREAELIRLQRDPRAAAQLEIEDRKNTLPASSGPFPTGQRKSEDLFRERWRKLVAIPEEATPLTNPSSTPATGAPVPSNITHPASTPQHDPRFPAFFESDLWPNSNLQAEPRYLTNQDLSNTNTPLMATTQLPLLQPGNSVYNAPVDWGIRQPLLWADADPSVDFFAGRDLDAGMDLDTEVNWFDWVESTKGMEWCTRSRGL